MNAVILKFEDVKAVKICIVGPLGYDAIVL